MRKVCDTHMIALICRPGNLVWMQHLLCDESSECISHRNVLVQEKCRRTERELALKTEECKRLQEQHKSFAALMGALEAEHRRINASLLEGRKLVKGNRLVVSKQTSWLQSLVVKEELLLGAPGFSRSFTLASIKLSPWRSGSSPAINQKPFMRPLPHFEKVT